MQVMIDIVGSVVIAGMVFLMLFRMNATMENMTFQNTLDVITQENSTTIAGLINYDFYKIGYKEDIANPNPIIEYADSDEIVFRADIDNNGTIDTVHYFTSATPYYVHGSPTQFKKLYRLVNASSGPGANLGITSFKLSYFDTLGVPIAFASPVDTPKLKNIQSVKIQMMVKNPISVDTTLAATFDTTFAATYWEKWISPKNLRRVK